MKTITIILILLLVSAVLLFGTIANRDIQGSSTTGDEPEEEVQ